MEKTKIIVKVAESLDLSEKRLNQDRKDKDQAAYDTTLEQVLEEDKRSDRKNKDSKNIETMLREQKIKAPNIDGEGLTEKRLDNASKDLYPHRNEKAWTRTKDKRPVNALKEEMGDASDESKEARYESKVSTASFNLSKMEKQNNLDKFANLIDYKNQSRYNLNLNDVKICDQKMSLIMEKAMNENRMLNPNELSKVASLKIEKVKLLGLL